MEERSGRMTYKEAIAILDGVAKVMPFTDEAVKVAKESLEKQVPLKPMKMLSVYGEVEYDCKNCGTEVIDNGFDTYCPACGQAIDWSYEE